MKEDIYLKIRLTPQIKAHIKERSASLGLTMAAYMRFLALKDAAHGEEAKKFFVIDNLDQVVDVVNKMRLKKAFKVL